MGTVCGSRGIYGASGEGDGALGMIWYLLSQDNTAVAVCQCVHRLLFDRLLEHSVRKYNISMCWILLDCSRALTRLPCQS